VDQGLRCRHSLAQRQLGLSGYRLPPVADFPKSVFRIVVAHGNVANCLKLAWNDLAVLWLAKPSLQVLTSRFNDLPRRYGLRVFQLHPAQCG
jgi:hypothetical protein